MNRILHVVGRMDRGGTEAMLMSHYRHLNRKEIQFDFVVHTTDHCNFEDEILSLGGRILRVPRFSLYNYCQYCKAWDDLFIANREYKVIHVHHFLVAGIILPIAAKHGLEIRIAHSHNTKPPIFILKEKVMWLFHARMIKYATLNLACSVPAGEYLFGKVPFSVFNNAIETERYRYNEKSRKRARDEFGFTSSDYIVGHIGSFRTKQKNHAFLIDIFDEVVKLRPNTKLLLVGVGDLQKEIYEKVCRLGLSDKVVFAGLREDVPEVLSAMDVFVFPSFFEGFGIVGIEAQAAGLPCVASDTIPKEACLTDLFNQMSLAQSASDWARAVISVTPKKCRALYNEDVANSEYDVLRNVKKLEYYYHLN